MAEQQFKRNTAMKLRIGDILIGKPIMNGDRFGFLELGDKKIVRVNLVGNIVDKYEGQGESRFLSFTLDDGSGQIRIKVFADDVDRFKNFYQGLTVVLVGVVRYWNDELYISPEIIKEANPKYLLIRKLETEKEKRVATGNFMQRDQIIALKDRILEMIKNAEAEGGVDTEKMILSLNQYSPDIINREIQKLLEEGIVFEPRPGKIRYLG